MTYLAISNFPSRFNEHKLLPAFHAREISDVEFLSTSEARSLNHLAYSRYDQVFLFCDMLGHSDYYDIKTKVQKSGKQLKLLNRKTASWPGILSENKDMEKQMAAQKSVLDSAVESLCQEYADSYRLNEDDERLFNRCAKYWTGRPLTSHATLENYINRLVKSGQSPEWFEQFYYDERKKIIDNRANQAFLFTTTPDIVEQTSVRQNVITESPVKKTEPTSEDLVSWNNMLEEENAMLVGQMKLLKDNVAEKDKKIAELQRELSASAQAKSTERSKDAMWKIKEAVIATNRLVELEVMDPKEAFERIVRVLLQSGA